MTDSATRTSRASTGRGSRKNVSVEDLLVGRLTLLALRNQLNTRVAELRSQLVVAEGQLRQCIDLLARADEKLARQDPAVYAALSEPAEEPASGAIPAPSRPQGNRKTAAAKKTRKGQQSRR